jgi:hypothetical protein
MSHLRAEKHIDKRGVAVTRHVRVHDAVGVGRKPIPAPVAVNPEQSKQMTRESLQSLREAGLPLRNNNYATKNLYHLANKNPELLAKVVAHIRNADSGEKAVWDRTLTNESRHPVSKTDQMDASSIYEADMKVFPVASQVADFKSEGYAAKVINDIGLCRTALANNDIDDEPDVLSATVIAMAVDKSANDGYGYTFDYPKYAEDISHIAEHPEEVASIVPELIRRQTLDSGVIASILSVSTASMRDGAL